MDALNEKGAHIVGTVDFTVPVKAVTPEQMEGIYDIVFLFTKQTANDVVLPNLPAPPGAGQYGMHLQNGVPEPMWPAMWGSPGLWAAPSCGEPPLWSPASPS